MYCFVSIMFCSMYCLFVLFYALCVNVYCTTATDVNPIAVKYITSYHIISYHIISYHITSYHISKHLVPLKIGSRFKKFYHISAPKMFTFSRDDPGLVARIPELLRI